jgi:hypothetical protein
VNNIYRSIPKQIKEWQANNEDEIYNRKTIYKYINGGAELYLAYDFKEVCARKYTGPGDNEIALDIYDMGTPADAFGVFGSEREDDEAGIGQGSEYSEGLLRFWQDRFFVSILAVGEEKTVGPIIKELGKVAAAAIKSTGPAPDMLKHLPREGLDKKRIRYFHKNLLLNKHYYLADENILNLSRKTDCLLAEYPIKDQEPTYLLLIKYPGFLPAKKAYAKFLKAYMPESLDKGIVETENQRWAMAKHHRDMITIVFDALGKDRAEQLQSAVNYFEKEK